MNEVIVTLDQHEINPTVPVGDRETYFKRRAARAVLVDTTGRIALMYAGQRDYYKLPGGGIDDEEDIQTALARELMEEVGATAKVIKSLGSTVEWRDTGKLHQISYAFLTQLAAQDSSPNFTESELAEGFALKWVANLDEAIQLVERGAASSDDNVMFMARRDAAILRAAK
jgi:8-oxo-dGTP diphosphatase